MSAIHELDETDPVLGRLLEILKAAPERDHRSAREGRSKFLAELNELFPAETAGIPARPRTATRPTRASAGGWTEFVRSMFRPPRLVWAPITIGLTVLFFLVFTGMATVRVAEAALPGDALYSLKTSIEQAELAVVTDPVDEAALNLKYAERRLVEASALTATGRIGDAQALVVESDARMKSAYATMLTIRRTDPVRAEQLRKIVQYRMVILNGLVTNISASAPPALTTVLQSVMSSVNSMAAADQPPADPTSPPPASGGQPGSDNTNDGANENANDGTNANDVTDDNDNDVANDNDNDAPNENANTNDNEGGASPNNNGDGVDNNNGGGQENNNGGGSDNNNGDGSDNNNGGGQENNNGGGGGNSEDGNDNNNGGGQEGNNGNGGGDSDPSDGNNGGGNDDQDDGSDDGNNGGGNDDKNKPKEKELTEEISRLSWPL